MIDSQLNGIFERHKDLFSADQAESIVGMMRKVAEAEGSPSDMQRTLIADVRDKLGMAPAGDGVWG